MKIGLRLLVLLLFSFPALATPPNILVFIADDWSAADSGIYGNRHIRTPNIDRLGREGLVFENAFCAAPSCTPSRAAILTGRYPHQLEEGGNLWSFLPAKYPVYPDLLEKRGYAPGFTRKGWGPGNVAAGKRSRNPAGPQFKSFGDFLKTVAADRPFCFWFGSQDPHRPYEKGSGAKAGLKADQVQVPPYWPDTPAVREDILDYFAEIERFDSEIGQILEQLEQSGRATNTLIVVTSDNGMPFPRAKANLYDPGTRMPLIVYWPGKIRPGRSEAFVNLADLAPTFLEIAGLRPPVEMISQSLVPLFEGKAAPQRDKVFLERERHANVRKGDLSYPMRAVRTKEYLYIRNLRAERWPAGDPEMHRAVGPFGDCDNSPTKSAILEEREKYQREFELCFGKRPGEELYHLVSDPHQIKNLSESGEHQKARDRLRQLLEEWMEATGDPRLDPAVEVWSEYSYFGDARPMPVNLRN